MFKALREMKEVYRFGKLPLDDKTFVFYSEGPEYWPHLAPLVMELAEKRGRRVCYVSSSAADPGLSTGHPNILPFNVGGGTARIAFFEALNARFCIMTMPDLDTFHIKRSRNNVTYVYSFHSIVSTHMVYRTKAFDAFDVVLTVGPHHDEEIRQAEKIRRLSRKKLIPCGYGKLDSILETPKAELSKPDAQNLQVLIAPSWGENGIVESMGETLIEALIAASINVTLRPHPRTLKDFAKGIAALEGKFGSSPLFTIDRAVSSAESLARAHVMISDWSGAALEFAFGFGRPVVFIDTPRKVNNPNYEEIPCEPLEVFIREQIGGVVAPTDLENLPNYLLEMAGKFDEVQSHVQASREKWVYNVGQSAQTAANALIDLAGKANDE